MAEQQALITVQGLKKYYPVKKEHLFQRERQFIRAVDGVSFELNSAQTLGLVGESGCGKSTVGKLLAGIEELTQGEILRHGNRRIQMIFQDPYASLNPRKRVYDIIAEPMLWHGLTDKEHAQERVGQLLRDVGLLENAMERYPHEFSGGQRQRISIAKALSLEPSVIICDEPVSALDMSVQAQVLNLFRDLQEKRGLSYLFIAHGLGAVHYISHRTAVMYLGKIVEIADGDEIYRAPKHPYTRMLIASVPVADPVGREEREVSISGEVPSAIHIPEGCRFCERCPYADAECQRRDPDLTETEPGSGHFIACLHPNGVRRENS